MVDADAVLHSVCDVIKYWHDLRSVNDVSFTRYRVKALIGAHDHKSHYIKYAAQHYLMLAYLLSADWTICLLMATQCLPHRAAVSFLAFSPTPEHS